MTVERYTSQGALAKYEDASSGSLLRVALNDEIIGKIDFDTDKRGRWSLTHNFNVVHITPEELARRIEQRQNFTAVCLNREGAFHRKKEYFKQSDLLAIDIDNDQDIPLLDDDGKASKDERGRIRTVRVRCGEEDYIILNDLLNDPFVHGYALIIYTSPSHTEQHHKLRIIFWLPRTITDRDEFERLLRIFIWKYKSDPACKDASRLYFGTGRNGTVVYLGNRLTDEAIKEVSETFDLAHPRVELAASVRFIAQADPSEFEDRRQWYAERAKAKATEIIFQSKSGRMRLGHSRNSL